MTKKVLAALLVGAMCLGTMTGCGSSSDNSASSASAAESASASTEESDGVRITLIMSSRDQFLSSLEQAAIKAAEANGITLVTQDAQNDAAKQISFIEAAVNAGDAAVIVNPVDSDAAQSLVEAANGTPLVFVNRVPTDLNVLAAENVGFCGSNEDTSGYFQGEYLAEYFKEKGVNEISYLMLQGIQGHVSTSKRSAGVLKALEDNGMKISEATAPLCAEYDRAEAQEKVSSVISGGTTFDCIIANNDEMALGAIEACEDKGVEINFPIVGIDCTDVGAQAIKDGKMAMTVFQNPEGQGEGSLLACLNLINGKALNEGTSFELDDSGEDYSDSIVWVPFEPVTAENVSQYK